MREYDWLLTALIHGLIGCFRFKPSDLTQFKQIYIYIFHI